jgi:hypothetical protein
MNLALVPDIDFDDFVGVGVRHCWRHRSLGVSVWALVSDTDLVQSSGGIPIGGHDGTKAGGEMKPQGPILIALTEKITKGSISEMGEILSDPNDRALRNVLMYICFCFPVQAVHVWM